VQENTVVHTAETVSTGLDARTTLGNYVSVGPGCVLAACTVHSTAVLGGRVTVGAGAVVEPGAVVAAGSVIPPGGLVPAGEVWGGVGPGLAFIRRLGGNERLEAKRIATALWETADSHRQQYLQYNSAAWERARVDAMEAAEREEYIAAMRARIAQQGDQLREELGVRREELRKSGALGEAVA
jgi:carbonic anhydrase/acetyltransferase-like protein (isoleucine patch superfamily)